MKRPILSLIAATVLGGALVLGGCAATETDENIPLRSTSAIEYDGTLYYSSFSDTTDTNCEIAEGTKLPVVTSNFVISEDTLFYESQPQTTKETEELDIYRSNLDGSDATLLVENADYGTFFVSGTKLYYQHQCTKKEEGYDDDQPADNFHWIRYDTETGESLELEAADGSAICLLGATDTHLYYAKYDVEDNYHLTGLYRSNTEMKKEVKFWKGEVEPELCQLMGDGTFVVIPTEMDHILTFDDDLGQTLNAKVDLEDSSYPRAFAGTLYAVNSTGTLCSFDLANKAAATEVGTLSHTGELSTDLLFVNDGTVLYGCSYEPEYAQEAGNGYNAFLYIENLDGGDCTECGHWNVD